VTTVTTRADGRAKNGIRHRFLLTFPCATAAPLLQPRQAPSLLLTPLLHIVILSSMLSTPPTLSATERVVLDLLAAKQDRMYGLELVAESRGRLKRGTVYVILGRMQQKGYVEAEPEKFTRRHSACECCACGRLPPNLWRGRQVHEH
jgi:hypothetical protein